MAAVVYHYLVAEDAGSSTTEIKEYDSESGVTFYKPAMRRRVAAGKAAAKERIEPGTNSEIKNKDGDQGYELLEIYEKYASNAETPRAKVGLYEILTQCDGFGVRSVEEFEERVKNLRERHPDPGGRLGL